MVNESFTTRGTSARSAATITAASSGSREIEGLLISPPPKQAARPIPKNQNEHDEDTDGLECGFHEIAGHRFDDSDQDPGDKRAGQRTEASHADRNKCHQAEHCAN